MDKIQELIDWCDERIAQTQNEERFQYEQMKSYLLSLQSSSFSDKQVIRDEEIEKLAYQFHKLPNDNLKLDANWLELVKDIIKFVWKERDKLQSSSVVNKNDVIDRKVVLNLMNELAGDIIRNNKIGEFTIGGMSTYYPYIKKWLNSKESQSSSVVNKDEDLYTKSEVELSDRARKMNLDFTLPSDYALGWRHCFEWLTEHRLLKI